MNKNFSSGRHSDLQTLLLQIILCHGHVLLCKTQKVYYVTSVCNSKRDINIKSGNLWCDLTDHLPNYILIFNKYNKTKLNPRLVRIFSDSNIDKFKKAISEINWQQLYALDDVNLAYLYFIDLITRSYHTCFPLVKLSRKQAKDKIWITPGLKLSSKHKNKLYKNTQKQKED